MQFDAALRSLTLLTARGLSEQGATAAGASVADNDSCHLDPAALRCVVSKAGAVKLRGKQRFRASKRVG
jgi:hypothetical protein